MQQAKRWVTEDIKKIITAAVPGAKSKRSDEGGDYDTCNLYVYIPGQESKGAMGRKDCLHICGFKEDAPEDRDPDDMDVNHVAMANIDADDDGGIQTRDKVLRAGYYAIREALEDAGFHVVDSMDPYF